MKSLSVFLFAVSVFLVTSIAHAQSSLEGFATGRYEIHKSTKSPKLSRKPSANESVEAPVAAGDDGMNVRILSAKELEAEKARVKAEADKKLAEQKKLEEKQTQAISAASPAPAVNEEPKEEPSIAIQAESLFSNKAEQVYDYYRQEVHPDDIRNNKVEIEFSPIVAYNDSHSSYSFRNYQSFFEVLTLKANVWLTPLIGVSGKFSFSFGADVDGVKGTDPRVQAKYENLDLGLNFRKFFGNSRLANSLEFSVLYGDSKMNVANDNVSRADLKSTGLGVGLKARLPTSLSYSWLIGGTFYPRLQHSESGGATNISSGNSDENIRIGFDFGGEWKFSRSSQMLWNAGISSEKNLFSGSATLPDPSTGNTPTNVSVTNTMYTFNLGYRWGQ